MWSTVVAFACPIIGKQDVVVHEQTRKYKTYRPAATAGRSRSRGQHVGGLRAENLAYRARANTEMYSRANMLLSDGPKKRPELSHGVMQQSRWNESAEKKARM